MKSIYFGDKVINFAADAPAGAALLPDPPRSIAKVLQNLEITKSVWVVSPLWQKLFDDFSSLFDVRRAAGGVVADPSGNVLMILRHGRWDLPKGHIERGESARQCAEREVMEECGVRRTPGR
jgi:hypothetical protein